MARLPQPGSDDGTWGDILNDFLAQIHKPDGTLKDNSVNSATLAPGAVDTASMQDGIIVAGKLSAGTGSNGQVLTYDSAAGGGFRWAAGGGSSDPAMGGDLSGTASNAQIVAGAVGTSELANAAVVTAKLADSSITSAKIADGTIAEADLSSAVQTKLNSVGGSVADGSITPAKLSSDTPTSGEILSYNGTGFEWITAPAAGGGGEANTASNIGAAGVGIYKQKTGVNFEFKRLNVGSNRVTITDDTANNEVDIDVNESNLNLANFGGSLAQSQVTGLGTSLAAKLDASEKGAAGGVATLDASGKVPSAQLPASGGGMTDPTTTKGDLIVRNTTTPTRLAVGTNGQILTADSTTATGVRWAPAPAGGGGFAFTPSTVNGSTTPNYTAVINDAIFVNTTGGAVTITLPTPTLNATVWVKRVDSSSNSVQVAAPAGSYIDAASVGTVTVNQQFSSFVFWSDGTNWFRW